MKVLISRASALGDIVCCLPVATALKNSFPDCQITWLVDPKFSPIVECCPAVDKVTPYRYKTLQRVHFEEKYDLALDLQGLLKSAWPLLFAKAATKLGYHWQREGSNFVTSKVLPDPTSNHVVDQYVDVARAAGANAEKAQFHLSPKPQALDSCHLKLNQAGISGRFVVLNPSAAWITKRWPPESFAKLIDLLKGLGIRAVLIGANSASDRQLSAQIGQLAHTPVADLTGQTNLDELIALLSLCAAHVGGDTGSSHLAAALGRTAVGLYSITNPVRSCPYGAMAYCHYNKEALSQIKPEEVRDTVALALELG
jgi:lipopolysaccharide heptosyltransferase I